MKINYIHKQILLFIVGMCLYITIEVLFREESYRLMGLIGGISMILLDKINDEISWDIPLICQMIIGGILITCLELLGGEFALNVLNKRMWDYSGLWMSMFDGLICPLFSFFWMLLSGLGIILADAINYYVLHEQQRPYYLKLNGNIWFCFPERICGGDSFSPKGCA